MIRKFSGVYFFFILFFFKAYAQPIVSDYPEVIHTDFLNPTYAIKRLQADEDASAGFVNQRYTNLLSDISFMQARAFLRIKENHQVGLSASSLKEGPLIDKTRAYLHYAYRTRLFRETFGSAGISGGLFKLGLEDPQLGTKQATSPDAGLDFAITNQRYFAYYSLGQILGSEVRPLFSSVKLRKYHEIRAGITSDPDRLWIAGFQLQSLMYSDRQLQLGGSINLKYNNIFNLGLGTYNLDSYFAQGAINFPLFDVVANISLFGSYRQVTKRNQFNAYFNSWEVGLSISKKNEDVVDEE